MAYGDALQAELAASGFLDVVSQEGFGALEGALLVEAAAGCPISVEVAASALIAPLIGSPGGPIALVWAPGKPTRYLQQAQTMCVFASSDVLVGPVPAQACRQVESVVAYPLGTLATVPEGLARHTGHAAAAIRRRALIGIAAEAAGLMRGALQHTVQYVKDRQQFGQPLGHFQAIQHRLAEDAQLVHACRSLALRAAWADDDLHAGTACLYAQEAIRKVTNDCHQFTGAMGLTLEFPLHLWTYRLKYLQGEAGGKAAQAASVASDVWGARVKPTANIRN